jgi:trans-aconitate methyltransferase
MTLQPEYFDSMYQLSPDPWGFESRWYEARKYAISLAVLPAERYCDAFEPGCSIGVLTRSLAARCDSLLSCDASPAAVTATARRTAELPNVRVEQRVLPGAWPEGEFDLIVLSELLYYFAGADLDRMLDLAVTSLRPAGTLLAVHWRHPVADYPRSGDEVHMALRGRALARVVDHQEADFLAEVYIRGDGRPISVAEAGGLV